MLAGYPMVDVKVELIYGCVPRRGLAREMAFKIAGSMAFKEAAQQAQPGAARADDERRGRDARRDFMGDVLGDLSARRGKIGGMTQRGEAQVIAATVPLAEMFGYSTKLRSMTQGRAVYSMEFAHYEEVPKTKAEADHHEGEEVSGQAINRLTRIRTSTWQRQNSSGPSRT